MNKTFFLPKIAGSLLLICSTRKSLSPSNVSRLSCFLFALPHVTHPRRNSNTVTRKANLIPPSFISILFGGPAKRSDSFNTIPPSWNFASTSTLEHAIYHVFLPPRTPQRDDTDIVKEHGLIESLLASTNKLSEICSTSELFHLAPVARMLRRLLRVKPGMEDDAKRKTMKNVILELQDGGNTHSFTLEKITPSLNRH